MKNKLHEKLISIYEWLIKKEKKFILSFAILYVSLIVLHIAFYAQMNKEVRCAEIVTIPFIAYGIYKLMFKPIRKNAPTNTVLGFITFFFFGAIYGLVAFLYEYITLFPNGYAPGILLCGELFLELISEIKKIIMD